MVWLEFSPRGVRRVLSRDGGLWVAWDDRNGFNSVQRVGGTSDGGAGSLGYVIGLAGRGREGSKVMLDTASLLGSVAIQGHRLSAEQHGEPLPLPWKPH